jgi:hypothetical protein
MVYTENETNRKFHSVKKYQLFVVLSKFKWKSEVRENLGDFRKSIKILTFLSPLPHVPLPFTKRTCCTMILKRMQLTSLECNPVNLVFFVFVNPIYYRVHQIRRSVGLFRLGFNEIAQFLSKSKVLVALSVFSSQYFKLFKNKHLLKFFRQNNYTEKGKIRYFLNLVYFFNLRKKIDNNDTLTHICLLPFL